MSSLDDPHFTEVYTICKAITENFCDDNPLLESDMESMMTGFMMLEALTIKISMNVAQYDSKTGTKANGFRSLLRIVRTMARHCIEVFETIKHQVSTLGYVSSGAREDFLTWSAVLKRMINILELALELKESNDQLYPDNPDAQSAYAFRLTQRVKNMDVTPFYGSALGFHFRGDSRRIMLPLAISMASYSDIYGGNILGKMERLRDSSCCWNYIKDPKMMAKKVVENSRNMPVDFIQNFFNMAESPWVTMVKTLPKIRTSINTKISFEAIEVPQTNSDQKFQVPIPTSHISKKSVQVQFMANYRTREMLGTCGCTTRITCSCNFSPPSDLLIFHAHGGGFVSQTSKSHLDYLHQWSSKLNIPIISVDYSLAPEAPYPRALEEVFYV